MSTFKQAAERVLRESGEPLHYTAITERALERNWVDTQGTTPAATMNAQLAVAVKTKGDASKFVRTKPGVFGLREWAETGVLELREPTEHGVKIPFFPGYQQLRAVLPAWEGLSKQDITGLNSSIQAITGTPQDTVDWTDPDTWISERLQGQDREVAERTWQGSSKQVNPRHMMGCWLVASNYELLSSAGRLEISSRGRDFIDDPAGEVVRGIDLAEGVMKLVELIADLGPLSSGNLLDPWMQFLATASHVRSINAGRERLSYRLRNIRERGFVERHGVSYSVTDAGVDHVNAPGGGTERELMSILRTQQREIRETIRSLLAEMDPIAMEHLVKDLLEAMGYDDVEVTSPANDGGVDVVGRIDMGITSVREVIQVKRMKQNVRRPVLDQLRGSLHRFGAHRGTIITSSGFAKGTEKAALEPGAAPITLINGERLIDLLIENGIGVRKRTVDVLEIDHSAFAESNE